MFKKFIFLSQSGGICLNRLRISLLSPKKTSRKRFANQNGRNIVITGGIGYEAVKKFLAAGAHLIIGCRRPSELVPALSICRVEGLRNGTFEVLEVDLMTLESVRKFADVILKKTSPFTSSLTTPELCLHLARKLSTDSNLSWPQTNSVLGHFLLTSLLLPKVREHGLENRQRLLSRSLHRILNGL